MSKSSQPFRYYFEELPQEVEKCVSNVGAAAPQSRKKVGAFIPRGGDEKSYMARVNQPFPWEMDKKGISPKDMPTSPKNAPAGPPAAPQAQAAAAAAASKKEHADRPAPAAAKVPKSMRRVSSLPTKEHAARLPSPASSGNLPVSAGAACAASSEVDCRGGEDGGSLLGSGPELNFGLFDQPAAPQSPGHDSRGLAPIKVKPSPSLSRSPGPTIAAHPAASPLGAPLPSHGPSYDNLASLGTSLSASLGAASLSASLGLQMNLADGQAQYSHPQRPAATARTSLGQAPGFPSPMYYGGGSQASLYTSPGNSWGPGMPVAASPTSAPAGPLVHARGFPMGWEAASNATQPYTLPSSEPMPVSAYGQGQAAGGYSAPHRLHVSSPGAGMEGMGPMGGLAGLSGAHGPHGPMHSGLGYGPMQPNAYCGSMHPRTHLQETVDSLRMEAVRCLAVSEALAAADVLCSQFNDLTYTDPQSFQGYPSGGLMANGVPSAGPGAQRGYGRR